MLGLPYLKQSWLKQINNPVFTDLHVRVSNKDYNQSKLIDECSGQVCVLNHFANTRLTA